MPMSVNPVTRAHFQPVQPTGWDAYPQKKEEVKSLLLSALREQVDDRFRARGELAPHFMHVDAREYLRLVLNEFPDVLDAHFASYINNPDQSLRAVTETFLRANYQQIGARFETFAREVAKGAINYSLQGMLRQQPYLTYSDVFGADDAPFLDGGSGVTFFSPGRGLSVVPPARGAGSQHASSVNSGGAGTPSNFNQPLWDEVARRIGTSAQDYPRVDGKTGVSQADIDSIKKYGVFTSDNSLLGGNRAGARGQPPQSQAPVGAEQAARKAPPPVDVSGLEFTDSSEIFAGLNLQKQPVNNTRVILDTRTDDPRQAKVNDIKRMFAELSDPGKSEDGLRRIARELNEVQTLFDDAGGCAVLDGRITKSFDTLRKYWAALADPVALKRLDNAILAFNADPASQRALDALHKELGSYTRTFDITDAQRFSTAGDVQGVNPIQTPAGRSASNPGPSPSIPDPGDSICTSFPAPPELPFKLREINWGSGSASGGVFDPPAPAPVSASAAGGRSSPAPLTPESLYGQIKKDPGMNQALFILKGLTVENQWQQRGLTVNAARLDALFEYGKAHGDAAFDRNIDDLAAWRKRYPDVFQSMFARLKFPESGQ